MNEPLLIGPDTKVTLHFTLRLASGEEVDTTRNGAPATFVMGDGNLLPGFESVLLGLRAGDRRSVLIDPQDGFGSHNPQNVQVIDRALFAPDVRLERGLVVSFADGKGELPGVVMTVDGDQVTVDFNHPLAGRDLTFEVEILDVQSAAQAVPVALRAATPRPGGAA